MIEHPAEPRAEIRELYWSREINTLGPTSFEPRHSGRPIVSWAIPVQEILETYAIPHVARLIEIVGPERLLDIPCQDCGGEILARSRSDFHIYLCELRRHERSVARGYSYGVADSVCHPCQVAREDARRAAWQRAEEERQAELKLAQHAAASMARPFLEVPYADYLDSPEWTARRRRALELAGHRCQLCASPNNLHVHHRTYVRRGREEDRDLTVLCAPCHKMFHAERELADGGRADP